MSGRERVGNEKDNDVYVPTQDFSPGRYTASSRGGRKGGPEGVPGGAGSRDRNEAESSGVQSSGSGFLR